MSFEKWMKQVDKWCWQEFGVSVHDLPDCCYCDWYDADTTPRKAAWDAAIAGGWV